MPCDGSDHPCEKSTELVINWKEINPIERTRIYHFGNGEIAKFENVARVEIRASGTHRIETAEGRKAFVRPGWQWLEIDTDAWTF